MPARTRNAWLLAGLLLFAAGVMAAVSSFAHWWPCFDGGARSDLCLQRRDSWLVPPYMSDPSDRVPWVTGPAAIASLLAGLAWPVAMRAVRLGRVSRFLGVLLALQTVSIGVWSVVSAFTPLIDPELPVPLLWYVGGDLVAVALGVAMVLRSADEQRVPLHLAWPIVVLIGATTFGFVRWVAELLVFHGHLGDGYPRRGAGLGLAETLLLCGTALLVRSSLPRARADQRPTPDKSDCVPASLVGELENRSACVPDDGRPTVRPAPEDGRLAGCSSAGGDFVDDPRGAAAHHVKAVNRAVPRDCDGHSCLVVVRATTDPIPVQRVAV